MCQIMDRYSRPKPERRIDFPYIPVQHRTIGYLAGDPKLPDHIMSDWNVVEQDQRDDSRCPQCDIRQAMCCNANGSPPALSRVAPEHQKA